jgi:hypothetical protein
VYQPTWLGRLRHDRFNPPYKLNDIPDPANDSRYWTRVLSSRQTRKVVVN